jgi:hypothetical protein
MEVQMVDELPLLDKEEWRPVVGFEGIYEVSSWGRVKRVKACMGATVGRILKPAVTSCGYPFVVLTDAPTNRRQPVMVHHLVTDAFLGPRPPLLDRNHIDGVKSNNHASNLEYVTRRYNLEHAAKLHLSKRKLSDDDVRAIRQRAGTESYAKLSRAFGITVSVVDKIIKRRMYRWLD